MGWRYYVLALVLLAATGCTRYETVAPAPASVEVPAPVVYSAPVVVHHYYSRPVYVPPIIVHRTTYVVGRRRY